MAIMILAGGCRSTTDTDKTEDRSCTDCPDDTGCDLAPRAQELARIIARQWVKTRDRLPPQAVPLLYLEYAAEAPSGTVHYGQYNRRRRTFIDQGSGDATPQALVMAWMPIPDVPTDLHAEGWLRLHGGDCSDAYLYLD